MAQSDGPQVMQVRIDRKDNLPKLRAPAWRLGCSDHKLVMVVDRFEQGRLKDICGIENAVAAIGEAAWPVHTDMGKRCHKVRGTAAADPALGWNQIEIADRLHDAWVGFLLC